LISASSERTQPVIHTVEVDTIVIRSFRDSRHVDLERVDNFRPPQNPPRRGTRGGAAVVTSGFEPGKELTCANVRQVQRPLPKASSS
jgi:hypothetical protein